MVRDVVCGLKFVNVSMAYIRIPTLCHQSYEVIYIYRQREREREGEGGREIKLGALH